eukprot:5726853-Amphidinium_carterae.1
MTTPSASAPRPSAAPLVEEVVTEVIQAAEGVIQPVVAVESSSDSSSSDSDSPSPDVRGMSILDAWTILKESHPDDIQMSPKKSQKFWE